jgi:transcriptional regulator GlxA family with amidase domain
LAATGLLDGKTATTHWGVAKIFKESFPKVNLRTDLMVVDEGRIFCGGGMTADLNLSLYLINKYCGREVAEKNHNDSKILKAQEWIERNFTQNISIEILAKKVEMSTRNFNRRFKTATGETVVKYLQQVRIEAAKKELEDVKLSFDAISVHVGYENVSFFRRIFKQATGLSPAKYREKFFQYVEV